MLVPNDHALIAYLAYFFAFGKDPDRTWECREEGGRYYIYDDRDMSIVGPLGKKHAEFLKALAVIVDDPAFMARFEGALENGDTETAYELITTQLKEAAA